MPFTICKLLWEIHLFMKGQLLFYLPSLLHVRLIVLPPGTYGLFNTSLACESLELPTNTRDPCCDSCSTDHLLAFAVPPVRRFLSCSPRFSGKVTGCEESLLFTAAGENTQRRQSGSARFKLCNKQAEEGDGIQTEKGDASRVSPTVQIRIRMTAETSAALWHCRCQPAQQRLED